MVIVWRAGVVREVRPDKVLPVGPGDSSAPDSDRHKGDYQRGRGCQIRIHVPRQCAVERSEARAWEIASATRSPWVADITAATAL